MWIRTEKGDARNLALAYKIEFAEYRGKIKVYATFPVCTGKNSADPAFAEQSTLKTFSNIEDAEGFIDELVDALNGRNSLDYAFNWLKNPNADNVELPIAEEKTKNETLIDSVDGVPF